MNRDTPCRRVEDLLAAGRDLDASERRAVSSHLDRCEDCRAWVRLRDGLRPFVDATAPDVPEAMAASVWPNVEARLAGAAPPGPRPAESAGRRRRNVFPAGNRLRPRWWAAPRLVPALGAVAAVLVVGTVLLAGQVRSLRERETALVAAVDRREALIDHLRRQVPDDVGAGATVELATLVPGGETTVGDLLLLLDTLPSERKLLTPDQAESLMRRLVAAVGGETARLPEIETADGLQAGEAARLLAAFALDPEQKISRTRLHVMSRGIGL